MNEIKGVLCPICHQDDEVWKLDFFVSIKGNIHTGLRAKVDARPSSHTEFAELLFMHNPHDYPKPIILWFPKWLGKLIARLQNESYSDTVVYYNIELERIPGKIDIWDNAYVCLSESHDSLIVFIPNRDYIMDYREFVREMF